MVLLLVVVPIPHDDISYDYPSPLTLVLLVCIYKSSIDGRFRFIPFLLILCYRGITIEGGIIEKEICTGHSIVQVSALP